MSEIVISLSSQRGQRLLNEVKQRAEYFQPHLEKIFRKQVGSHTCGIQTCALLMSAAFLGQQQQQRPLANYGESDPVLDKLPFTEANMFDFPATYNLITLDGLIKKDGLTLDDVCDILSAHGCDITSRHAHDSDITTFRNEARQALADDTSARAIFVNYHMGVLKQESNVGHHSPLGAYDEMSDTFLVWDTWQVNDEFWVKTDDLFAAMNTTDTSSHVTRGYAIVDCSNLKVQP